MAGVRGSEDYYGSAAFFLGGERINGFWLGNI
jgi:hypothetical protein